jgi:Na+/proline symporter
MALAAILTMYAAFLVVGWLAARKVKGGTAADLIVAGRSMPLLLATLTMTATWVDGGYLLGTTEGTFKTSIASGLQGGVCFGLSLILGGLFFARRMRELEFTTLADPFEARFGRHWAAVLFLPAIAGEIFWSAELLVAIGSTFSVMLQMKLTTAILLSAIVVIAYTMVGGMWSVAYTDAFQLGLVVIGLLIALPYALDAAGGLSIAWSSYQATRPVWGGADTLGWWDVSVMLLLGGIPWNCYFQRVLSCKTPAAAQWHSLLAGVFTIALTIPPLLFGVAAAAYTWREGHLRELTAQPAITLPLLLMVATPPFAAMLGLGAIVGAVTSSFSSSILSASSLISWNGVRRLLLPDLSMRQLKALVRVSIVLLGACAIVMALKVQSVQALWFFTSDLVFVLLFPQLVCALYDPKANRAGSIAAFSASSLLRFGASEPLLGIPRMIPYPDEFPFRIAAAAVGFLLLIVVSRITTEHTEKRHGKTRKQPDNFKN